MNIKMYTGILESLEGCCSHCRIGTLLAFRGCPKTHRACIRICSRLTLRVQVPNNRILPRIVTYITTIRNPSTEIIFSFGPLGLTLRVRRYLLRRVRNLLASFGSQKSFIEYILRPSSTYIIIIESFY